MMGHPLGCWTSFQAQRRGRLVTFGAGLYLGAIAGLLFAWLVRLCPPVSS